MDNTLEVIKVQQIEDQMLKAADFIGQLKLYVAHYSLVKHHGKITTMGRKDEKIFCMCGTCSEEVGYAEKLATYNELLKPELDTVIAKLNSLDYRSRLVYFDSYFDINATYIFEDFDIKLSMRPTSPEENKIFNEFQYSHFFERYFVKSDSSIKDYFRKDFDSLVANFHQKRLNAMYPEQSARKEILLLNEYFQNHRNKEVRELFQQLIDGIVIDFSSAAWAFNHCLNVVEANESVKFLRYLENVNLIANTSSFTETFHHVVQQSDEAYKSYSVVTWNLVNGCIREIKNKLCELPNNDSRVAYLKTTLLSFMLEGFNDYFAEIEDYLGNDVRVNRGLEALGNVVSITNPEKFTPLYEGVSSVIHGRNGIVMEISDHIAGVYPQIDFSEIMKVVDYRTKNNSWLLSSEICDEAKIVLTNREKAQLYIFLVDDGLTEMLSSKEFNKKYSKNVELKRNDLIAGRDPIKVRELENILKHLKHEDKFPDLQKRISEQIIQLKLIL